MITVLWLHKKILMEYTQKYLGVKGLMSATYYQMIQKKAYRETENLIKQMKQKCKLTGESG